MGGGDASGAEPERIHREMEGRGMLEQAGRRRRLNEAGPRSGGSALSWGGRSGGRVGGGRSGVEGGGDTGAGSRKRASGGGGNGHVSRPGSRVDLAREAYEA